MTATSVDGPAFVAIAPSAIALYRNAPEGSPRNVWPAVVADIDRRPDRVRVRLDGALPVVAEVTIGALDAMGLRPGDPVWAVVKATEVTSYPA